MKGSPGAWALEPKQPQPRFWWWLLGSTRGGLALILVHTRATRASIARPLLLLEGRYMAASFTGLHHTDECHLVRVVLNVSAERVGLSTTGTT